MKKTYIKITHNDENFGYIETPENIMNALDGELDGWFVQECEVGDSITLTIIEMEESDYKNLSDFTGW